MLTSSYPEDKEMAMECFQKVKGEGTDTISVFDVVDIFRSLGIKTNTEEMVKKCEGWNIDFDKFLEVYRTKKDEKDRAEINELVIKAFEALGGQANKQGTIDTDKLAQIFQYYELGMEVEDFLVRPNPDITTSWYFDDFNQLFQ